MHPIRLLGLHGSLRQHSYNRVVLDLISNLLPVQDELLLHDLRGIPFFNEDIEDMGLPPLVEHLVNALETVDGLVMASPEYNHSMPAVLKNAIDWLSRAPGKPLHNKPVLIISATTGGLGGARVQYEIRRVLDAVGARPMVRPEVFIGMAHVKLHQSKDAIDPSTTKAISTQLEAFKEFMDVHYQTTPNRPSLQQHHVRKVLA